MHEGKLESGGTASRSEHSEFLRMDAVKRRTGLGRSTIYRLMAAHNFPRPVKLSGRAVGWRTCDLDKWSATLSSAAH